MVRIATSGKYSQLSAAAHQSYVPDDVDNWPTDTPQTVKQGLDSTAGNVQGTGNVVADFWGLTADKLIYCTSVAGPNEVGATTIGYSGGELTMAAGKKIQFRDANAYIEDIASGELYQSATVEITLASATLDFNASTVVTINGAANTDIVLGETANATNVRPKADNKTGLGTNSLRWSRCATHGISTKFDASNVCGDPPTDAEIDTAMGDTPANLGAGFIGVIQDSGTATDIWLVVSDGSNWFHSAKLTQAV